jgi:hypothetical protein
MGRYSARIAAGVNGNGASQQTQSPSTTGGESARRVKACVKLKKLEFWVVDYQ